MTKFDAAYHRERRRIREAKKKLAYDIRCGVRTTL